MFKKRRRNKGSNQAEQGDKSKLNGTPKTRTPSRFDEEEDEDDDDPVCIPQRNKLLKKKVSETQTVLKKIPKTRILPTTPLHSAVEVAQAERPSENRYSKENLERLRKLSIKKAPSPPEKKSSSRLSSLADGQVLTDTFPSDDDEVEDFAQEKKSDGNSKHDDANLYSAEDFIPINRNSKHPKKLNPPESRGTNKRQVRFSDVLKGNDDRSADYASEPDLAQEAWEDEQVERGTQQPHAMHPPNLFNATHTTPQVASTTYEQLIGELHSTLDEMSHRHHLHKRRVVHLDASLSHLQSDSKTETLELERVGKRYQFLQEFQTYFGALISCLISKESMVVKVEEAVAKHRAELYRSRARRFVQRVVDEICMAEERNELVERGDRGLLPRILFGHQSDSVVDELGRDRGYLIKQEFDKRLNEYKLRRENKTKLQNSNWNLDESDSENDRYVAKIGNVSKARDMIFSDVNEEFGKPEKVIEQFVKWKEQHASEYKSAYGALTLPELLQAYHRYELLLWNPVDAQGRSQLEALLQKIRDYSSDLLRNADGDDPNLVKECLIKVVCPLVNQAILSYWDATNTLECNGLSSTLAMLKLELSGFDSVETIKQGLCNSIGIIWSSTEKRLAVPLPKDNLNVDDSDTWRLCSDQFQRALEFLHGIQVLISVFDELFEPALQVTEQIFNKLIRVVKYVFRNKLFQVGKEWVNRLQTLFAAYPSDTGMTYISRLNIVDAQSV